MNSALLFSSLVFATTTMLSSNFSSEENIYKNVVIESEANYYPYDTVTYSPKKKAWKACKYIDLNDDKPICSNFSEEDTKVIVKEGYITIENGKMKLNNSLIYSSIYSDYYQNYNKK